MFVREWIRKSGAPAIVAVAAFAIVNISARADEPATKPAQPPAAGPIDAPAPRSAAHITLNDFLELYKKGTPEARREMADYLDASRLDDDARKDLPTLANSLAEFIETRKLAEPEVFNQLRLAENATEHCLFKGRPLVQDQPAIGDNANTEQKPELVCHIRLVKGPDNLWRFDAETTAKIKSLAVLAAPPPPASDAATTPDKPADVATPTKAEPAPAVKPAAEVPKQFRSVQATMRTFLQAFDANVKSRVEPAECLNLSERGLSANEFWGQALARGMKFVLDRTVYVQVNELTDDPAINSPQLLWTIDEKWPISLERMPDGRWLFSNETLDALPDMIRAVADAPPKVKNAPELSLFGTPELYVLIMVPDWAQKEIGFLQIWQWIGLLTIAMIGVVCDRGAQVILRGASRFVARRINDKTEEEFGDKSFRPIGLVLMAYVWRMLLPFLWLPGWMGTLLTTVSWLVLILAGIWATYRVIDIVVAFVSISTAGRVSTFDELLLPFLRKLLKIVVTILGIIYFFGRFYPEDITTLLGGLGIGGLAFALAAQDTIKNMFGSITVMLDRPFEIGDWVKIGDVEGTVESVGFRSTHIRTFYNSQINVPNGKLIDATVDNLGRRHYRRISTSLGLTYDTPPEKIEAFCEGIRELIRRHPYTRKDSYYVYFNNFGAHSLDVMLYCFHETPDWATELRERHRLFCDILRLANRLGVEFAFPTQTLHLHNADNAPPTHDAPPSHSTHLAPDILGRSEAAAIAKLSVPPEDSLAPVTIAETPQPVDDAYVKQRLGIKPDNK
ncbi:MAG: mechanosensitive ion channel family protein [Phycisphaerales bacterium]|nr:mechanosensitive ion channel family protein [Phycisphaerales bacterium]MCB9856271.1 mechanosensitive ion channel family protein [Phycisphaerales bacterium]MCB9863290.1 mechanosensitive ion channel family protein [Phycisphaerales bacterium]